MHPSLLCVACLGLLLQSPSGTGPKNFSSGAVPANELSFRLNADYLIQVEGRVGDQGHLSFLLDTGATISVVDRKIINKLKIESHPGGTSFSLDRVIHWKSAAIPEIQFGPIQATNVVTLVGDLPEFSQFARGVDAIIGLDLLRLSNFTVDFDSNRIIFRAPTQLVAALPSGKRVSNCLTVELQVQGQSIPVIVDTGFPSILLYTERLRKNVPALRTTGHARGVTIGGRMKAKQIVLPDVALGNTNRDVTVWLVESPPADVLPGVVGFLGIASLKAHQVDFDFSNKRFSWN